MRSTKRPEAHKKPSRHERINKKRYKKTSNGSWGWKDDLYGLFIDDINEAIRTKKSRRTEGKGCWKLVPKDSCEVYKDRKKRSADRKRPELSSEEISDDTESRMEEDKKKNKKKLRKKTRKKNIQGRKYQPKNKGKKSVVTEPATQLTIERYAVAHARAIADARVDHIFVGTAKSISCSVSECSSSSQSTRYTDKSHMDN